MASIQKYVSGYRAFVYVKGTRDSATFRTRREAEAWASRRETELRDTQALTPGERTTLGDVLARYSREVSPLRRGKRWEQLRLDRMAREELPIDLPVAKLQPEHIAAWRDRRASIVAAGTVIRELGLLGAVLEHARTEWRLLTANPARDVKKPRAPDHREVVIGRAQIKGMLQALNYRPGCKIKEVRQAVAVCFLVALRTGMRAGELCGLTWARVLDDHCVLPVTKTVPRKVPLEPSAKRLLERMRGWDAESVFGLTPNTLDALFRKYRDKAGLSGFTFHDARHTAATWLSPRLDVLDLCKMFGWSNTKQALTYYNPQAGDIAKRLSASRSKRGQSH